MVVNPCRPIRAPGCTSLPDGMEHEIFKGPDALPVMRNTSMTHHVADPAAPDPPPVFIDFGTGPDFPGMLIQVRES